MLQACDLRRLNQCCGAARLYFYLLKSSYGLASTMSTRRLSGFIIGTVMLCMALFITSTGCVGYVDPGDGGGGVVVTPPEPDVVIFGGDYDRGRDVHAYSHRGYESRGAAHHRR